MRWIRPALALIFALAIVYGFVQGKISSETFIGTAAVTITWWFRARDGEKRNE